MLSFGISVYSVHDTVKEAEEATQSIPKRLRHSFLFVSIKPAVHTHRMTNIKLGELL